MISDTLVQFFIANQMKIFSESSLAILNPRMAKNGHFTMKNVQMDKSYIFFLFIILTFNYIQTWSWFYIFKHLYRHNPGVEYSIFSHPPPRCHVWWPPAPHPIGPPPAPPPLWPVWIWMPGWATSTMDTIPACQEGASSKVSDGEGWSAVWVVVSHLGGEGLVLGQEGVRLLGKSNLGQYQVKIGQVPAPLSTLTPTIVTNIEDGREECF